MRKILLQLDSDRLPSVFDAVTAYDAGVDRLLQYGGVEPGAVQGLVHGAMFTRGGEELKNSAVFIGGTDVSEGEVLLEKVQEAFFGPVRVSVMLDSNGCNTTATAAVIRMASAGDLAGKKVVVLAGTGPVGQRAATLLAMEGAEVVLTSRALGRAQVACDAIRERSSVEVTPDASADAESVRRILDGAYGVLCTGATGIMMVPESIWKAHPTLQVLADVNAVPPLGVEGTKPTWDGKEVQGKRIFGALGIGGLKMKIHRRCVAQLFERNDRVLDAEEVYAVAKELVA